VEGGEVSQPKREPMLVPVGYQTQQIRRRATRPLHSRKAVLAEAEAAFKLKTEDGHDRQTEK
jgi:hypothetical protein